MLWVLLLFQAASAFCSPLSDLSSPSQETRDRAAEILRRGYKAPARDNWEWLLQSVKPGDAKSKLLDLLRPYDAKFESSFGLGGGVTDSYRLDDLWVLRCTSRILDSKIHGVELIELMQPVWVEPPPNFTGVWTTYFVNGQKNDEIHYKNGKHFGEFVSFRSDGSKCFVQHFDESGGSETTGYYPSGKIEYRAHCKPNEPVRTYTWYNEDGSVSRTEQH
jgi:hypothetical protein